MVQPTRMVSCARAADTPALANSSAATNTRFICDPLLVRPAFVRPCRYGTMPALKAQDAKIQPLQAGAPGRIMKAAESPGRRVMNATRGALSLAGVLLSIGP